MSSGEIRERSNMNEEDIYDEDEEEEDDYQDPPEIEALLEMLRRIPKETVTAIDLPQYAIARASIESLIRIISVDYPDANFHIGYDQLLGTSLIFSVETDGINVYDTKELCKALAPVATIDVEPLVNGKVRVNFKYSHVRFFVPPDEKE